MWLLQRSLALFLLHVLAIAQGDPAKDLKSKDPVVRLAAVEAVVASDAANREKLLIGALKDRDWEVVEIAARALGEAGSAKAFGPLVSLALDAPIRRLRRTAAESLARIDAEGAFDKLNKKIGKEGERVCRAYASLAPALDGKVSLKGVEKGLKSKEADVRAAAAHAMVALAGQERPARLRELLSSEELLLAAEALEGAARAADPACLDAVFDVLNDPDANDVLVRRALAACHATFVAHPELGANQLRLLEAVGSGPEEMLVRYVRLIGHLVDERNTRALEGGVALDMLTSLLGSKDARARAAAAEAMTAVTGEEAAEQLLAPARTDENARVRLIALLARLELSGVDDEDTRALAVDRLAKDADAEVREAAAVALGTKGVDGVTASLAAALEDPDWRVAVSAAVSLGKTRAPEAVAPLVRVYSEGSDWRLRGAAIVGLSHLRERGGVPTVIEALADEEPLVRRTALEFLKSIANRDLGDAAAWKSWWNENGERARVAIPEEVLERRRKLGYSKDPREIYRDLDVLVFVDRGDHLQEVLRHVGITHRTTSAGKVRADELHPDAVYVANCPGEALPEDLERLGWFVRVGGYLFGSCWSVQETIAKIAPGFVRRLPTRSEVLDTVRATPCASGSPYLEGVFGPDVRPFYSLVGAYLIDVVDHERVEVLVDSAECASRWGGGNLAAWFRVGHGVILDSVNHFDAQGLESAPGLKKPIERMAYAVDHMGLGYTELRALRDEKFWSKATKAAEEVKDLSVFRLVTNFVRQKRAAEDG